MQFNTLQFMFAFLPVALVGYWLLVRFASGAVALAWLLLMSVVFYAHASLVSLAIVVPSILFDYAVARALLRIDSSERRLRAALFVVGIVANIAFLGYFKYKNFFLDTTNTLLATHFELARTILPLGISFLTFQKVAFLADVQSGRVKAVRIADFLLFTLFFPRTVAGPIVHYGEVMPQLGNVESRSIMSHLAVGVALFSIGLFKKTVVADSVAQFVPTAFDTALSDRPPELITAWCSVLAYTYQLYFDFSGYSDMALGVAQMFGVRLPMNFNSPLKASSIVEFWSRWHISLTRFLTAYIYTPIVLHLTRRRMAKGKPVLRGKRSTLPAIAILVGWPTLITMVLSGFWHGAGWQFVVWGLLHGIYLAINQSWRMLRPRFWSDQANYDRVMKPLGFVLTFGAVVVALVFFRANSVTAALSVLSGMVGMNGIFSSDIQLLQSVGVDMRAFRTLTLPLTTFYWLIALFIAVTLLPNSLELLRRFQPALDFPELEAEAPRRPVVPAMMVQSSSGSWRTLIARQLCAAWSAAARLRYEGVALNRFTAVVAALMCVLGIMALNRGGTFLYFQF
jgi:D-alanyl-lipoteichoic acid acyltransferase DltB (MBOAT superfamily)